MLEADTPEGAWLREKVAEWLGRRGLSVCSPGALVESWFIWDEKNQNHLGNILAPTYAKAIIAAVEWVYEKEHDHD